MIGNLSPTYVVLTSTPPTDIIGCKLNVHWPFTVVISGTVWTVVGTWPTVGMIALLLGVEVDVTVELAGHITGTRGEVTVFTALFAAG